jgi:hypothetical protein
MGNLINFLFFRETGEHVRNMFFLCPQLTEDQGEFTKMEATSLGVKGVEEIPMKGLDPT